MCGTPWPLVFSTAPAISSDKSYGSTPMRKSKWSLKTNDDNWRNDLSNSKWTLRRFGVLGGGWPVLWANFSSNWSNLRTHSSKQNCRPVCAHTCSKYGPWEFLRHHSMKEFNCEIGICMAPFFLLFLGYELCLFIQYIACFWRERFKIWNLSADVQYLNFPQSSTRNMYFHITCIN